MKNRTRQLIATLAITGIAFIGTAVATESAVASPAGDTAWGSPTPDDTAWGTPPTTDPSTITPLDTAWG
ncbi:hypothetical protein [Streptomyces sp. NPDC005548]|uniref:hypothetical protein n=1 Tax=Streptomyces sp. NPDC005548 TaxID=3364724 RepID=UPI0036C0606D